MPVAAAALDVQGRRGDNIHSGVAGRRVGQRIDDGAAPFQDLLVVHRQPQVVRLVQAPCHLPGLPAFRHGVRRPGPVIRLGVTRLGVADAGVSGRLLLVSDGVQIGMEHNRRQQVGHQPLDVGAVRRIAHFRHNGLRLGGGEPGGGAVDGDVGALRQGFGGTKFVGRLPHIVRQIGHIDSAPFAIALPGSFGG